jgi:hypothetical protein
MRPVLKYSIIAIVLAALLYLGFGYLSSMVGWYGYKKWKYRAASQNIKESKERGVFIKSLHFRVEGPLDGLTDFEPFIEKGFKWGYHSSQETRDLDNSEYPYQLNFNYRPDIRTTILIRDDQLIKFDSAGTAWGYLKEPVLRDTIILTVHREKSDPAIIKVWN